MIFTMWKAFSAHVRSESQTGHISTSSVSGEKKKRKTNLVCHWAVFKQVKGVFVLVGLQGSFFRARSMMRIVVKFCFLPASPEFV